MGMEIQEFERGSRLTPKLKMFGRRFYFRIVDIGNNEIIAQSQPYKTKAQRDETSRRFAFLLKAAISPERERQHA